MAKRLELIPFLGVVTSIGSRLIRDIYATDCLNVTMEDGNLSIRRGFKRLQNPQANFVSPHGLFYLRGYDTSSVFQDEYLSIEKIGAQVKAFSRNSDTGAPSLITGAPADLVATTGWWASAFQDKGLITNGLTCYYHDVGDLTSWVEAVLPTPPTQTVAASYPPRSGYTREGWNGLNVATNITYTGGATATGSVAPGTSTGNLLIAHNAVGFSSIKIDTWARTSGATNWRNADIFGFTVNIPQQLFGIAIDPNSITAFFSTATKDYPAAELIVRQVNQFTWNVYMRFEKIGERAEWGDGVASFLMRYITIQYNVTAVNPPTIGVNHLSFSPLVIGGMKYVDIPGFFFGSNFTGTARFAATFYNTTTEIESELSDEDTVMRVLMEGNSVFSGLPKFGSRLQFTHNTSAVADKARTYVFNSEDEQWYRIDERNDAGTPWIWEPDDPITVLSILPEFNAFAFNNVGVKSMFSFRGHTCWLYKGGRENIQYSASGKPFKQFTPNQNLADLSLGAEYTLADDFADEPEIGFDIGRSVIFLGTRRAYAQTGSFARALTPTKAIPGSYGVVNPRAAARWRDENGNFGVVYVDHFSESVWYASAEPTFDGEQGFLLVELTESVRGLVREFLLENASPADLRVAVSDRTDTLFVIAKNRAIALRRKSIIDGRRFWEKHEWNMTAAAEVSFGEKGDRWIRSNGYFDENEWDTAQEQFIAPSFNMDGGRPLKSKAFWQSKVFQSPASSYIVRVERTTPNLSSKHSVKVISKRREKEKEWESGKKIVRFGPLQQGQHHQVKIIFNRETDTPIEYASFDMTYYGSERPSE